jgi:diguanylate cyclase (GGDEF)-like protein
MMLLLSPWRAMRQLHVDERQTIRQLNLRLRMIADGNRNIPLKDIVIERDDEIGALSRVVHDLAAEALSSRLQSQMLHRRMDNDVQLQTRKATAHLEKQAATDPLTGLGNRRSLEQRMSELLDHRSGVKSLLTVMAIDLDFFKDVNDALGHEAGDRCLVFLADLLKTGMRREDTAIRLGGDEFIVLMPDQSLESARGVASRIAALFSQMPWPQSGTPRPTLSFGLASRRRNEACDASDLLRRADEALYLSKHSGRSAVRVHGEAGRAA